MGTKIEPKKIKISIIDFLSQFRKHSINETDKNGTQIHYGDTVAKEGQNYFVAYRYGKTVLKQPETAHHIGISDYSRIEVTNICGAAMDYLIIGYDNEPFIQELLKLNLEFS